MDLPISKWLYILVGNDRTGKTTFQKNVIKILCDQEYDRLNCNKLFQITFGDAPRRFKTLSVINRSYQETRNNYGSVEEYFQNHFKAADVCILSSHAHETDIMEIAEMIKFAKRKYYTVGLVVFSNSQSETTARISEELRWDERFFLYNPDLRDQSQIEKQLSRLASDFSEMVLRRMNYQ